MGNAHHSRGNGYKAVGNRVVGRVFFMITQGLGYFQELSAMQEMGNMRVGTLNPKPKVMVMSISS